MKAMRALNAPVDPARSFDPLRFCAPPLAEDERLALVAEAAYFRAESRGFAPGHEVEDWLAAEAEIERRLAADEDDPIGAGGD
jgi:hypothetical protein